MKKIIIFCICILILATSLITVYAHSGGTDDNGGHYNHKTGEYHYHCSGHPEHSHYDLDGDGDMDCPYGYAGNSSSAESGHGYYLSSGWISDEEFDDIVGESYESGRTEGYSSGYEIGFEEGKQIGYDEGFLEMTDVAAERIEEAKETAYKDGRNVAYLLAAVFGIPIVSYFVSRKCEKNYSAREESYLDELFRLRSIITEKSAQQECMHILELLSEESGVPAVSILENLYISFSKKRGLSEAEAKAHLQSQKFHQQ